MLKLSLKKSLLLIVLLIVLCVMENLAQTKTCDLQLNVVQNQVDANVEGARTEGATAVLVNLKNGDEKKSRLVNEMPHFANLKEGKYSVSVLKQNYKNTIKRIDLNCSMLNGKNFVSEDLPLWSGNSKEKIHFINEDFKPSDINESVINDLALKMPKPEYPSAAKANRITGAVIVQIKIDEQGNVISAKGLTGHPLLISASLEAAKKARFVPNMLGNNLARFTGLIIYNFSPFSKF